MKSEPLEILLVEDNQDHVELIHRGLKDYHRVSRIKTVSDGEAALNYLFHRESFKEIKMYPRPDIIFLDLRLPKLDGLEVLQQIKTDEELCSIPVVVLTTSAAKGDIARAYERHANSYLVKPVTFDKFNQLMVELGHYWLESNRYPRVDVGYKPGRD